MQQPASVVIRIALEDTRRQLNFAGVFGRVLKIGDEDVYGHEVNLASKLGEDIARGGEILVTPGARAKIGEVPSVTWEEVTHAYVGEHSYHRANY